jgi:hypothetical protein
LVEGPVLIAATQTYIRLILVDEPSAVQELCRIYLESSEQLTRSVSSIVSGRYFCFLCFRNESSEYYAAEYRWLSLDLEELIDLRKSLSAPLSPDSIAASIGRLTPVLYDRPRDRADDNGEFRAMIGECAVNIPSYVS